MNDARSSGATPKSPGSFEQGIRRAARKINIKFASPFLGEFSITSETESDNPDGSVSAGGDSTKIAAALHRWGYLGLIAIGVAALLEKVLRAEWFS